MSPSLHVPPDSQGLLSHSSISVIKSFHCNLYSNSFVVKDIEHIVFSMKAWLIPFGLEIKSGVNYLENIAVFVDRKMKKRKKN